MRKINSKFNTRFISEDGGKLVNRDYFAYVELDKFALYALADGLDEDLKDESAKIAVTAFIQEFISNPGISRRRLKQCLAKAHKALTQVNSDRKLKVSIIIVVTNYIKVRYICAGNCRFYLARDGIIHKKSRDLSLTANLVEQELVPLDKAASHEERNNLYCYLGQDGVLKPDCSKKFKLLDGDIFLLLSRGAWEYCDEGELLDVLSEAKEPQEVLDQTEELILSRQPEDMDNYTLAVTYVDKIYHKPNKKWTAKKIILLLLPFVIIGAIIGITLFVRYRIKKNNTQAMMEFKKSAYEYAMMDSYQRANEDYNEALKLAKKIKSEKDKDELSGQIKLTEQILMAASSMDGENYQEAMNAFIDAKVMSEDAGNIGKEYIESSLNKINQFIQVSDLITDGDKQLEYGEPEQARNLYLQARELAAKLFDKEDKQEAQDKIDKIDEQKAEDKQAEKAEKEKKEAEKAAKEEKDAAKAEEEKVKAEEEKVKQEEEKAKAEEEKEAEKQEREAELEKEKAEKIENTNMALEIEEKGNAAFAAGSYEDAKMYYMTAQDLYIKLELDTRVENIREKIKLTESKASDQSRIIVRANSYKEGADLLVSRGEYENAKLMYLLARDLYENAGKTELVTKMDETIKSIEDILQKQNAQSQEQKEEDK